MPKKCPKFVTEYLIPSLNSQRFGSNLKWVDKKNSIFELGWCHKGDTHWSEGEAEVFVEWDKIKGHYQPNEREYFTRSKQRFRSLLYKLTLDGQIKKMKCDKKSKKLYCITGVKKLSRKRQSSNADSGIFSADDLSSDNIEVYSEDVNDDSNIMFCDMNGSIHFLEDHNYCKSLIDTSEFEGTGVKNHEDIALSTFPNGYGDTSKKILMEQNYLYYNDLSKFDSKEKNIPTDFSHARQSYAVPVLSDICIQGTNDEDLQIGSDNAVFNKNDDFGNGLYCTTSNENAIPMESTETFNSFNEDIKKYLSDLEMQDFSNLTNFWNRILSLS